MTLTAVDLSVRAGKATLLAQASLSLESGEIVAVVGPNGAGKTTLIRTISGDIAPAEGSVRLAGKPLGDWSGNELAQRRSVMSPDGGVAFGFTAREVALMGRMPIHGGDPTQRDEDMVDGLLEAVDCSGLGERAFSTLSTGERQRVQLARAIAQVGNDPDTAPDDVTSASRESYLLLDEPTSSLDPAHQHTAMRLLRRQADAGIGVLAVLHDLNLAAAYADRIVLMKDARIVETGEPVEIMDAELLERVFEVPMLVVPHPSLPHALVVAKPVPK